MRGRFEVEVLRDDHVARYRLAELVQAGGRIGARRTLTALIILVRGTAVRAPDGR